MIYEDVNLQTEIIKSVREKLKNIDEGLNDDGVMEIIEETVLEYGNKAKIGFREKRILAEMVFNVTRKELDILQPLTEDDGVGEIMVNGPNVIFVEKNGRMEKVDLSFDSREHLQELIRRLAAGVNREINEINPIVDARLEDGSRVNAVYSNVAIDGPILTIRKFTKKIMTMEDMISSKTITREAAELLKILVITGHNIFVSGGTSSGKTTFLNVLSEYIPQDERVIVIEDSAELKMDRIDNLVRLETKNANSQGKGGVNIRQLIKTAMRMRPDRIIVGEVRGGEALDMLQALNSGHDGCMSTGHSNSTESMMYRLETMILTAENFPLDAVRQHIVSALDIIVHLGRFSDMSRRVLEISEIVPGREGGIEMNRLFSYENGELTRTGNKIKDSSKLKMRWKGEVNGFM